MAALIFCEIKKKDRLQWPKCLFAPPKNNHQKQIRHFNLLIEKNYPWRLPTTKSPFIGNNVLSQCIGGGKDNGQIQASHWSPDIPPCSSLANQKWTLRQEKLQQEMVRLNNGGCWGKLESIIIVTEVQLRNIPYLYWNFSVLKSTPIYSSRKAAS